jgi:hypothetical protein
MKKTIFCLSVLLNATFSFGQIAISSNSNTTPHSAAMLEIRPSLTTNAKGLLMPCISYSDIFNISSPRFGLLVGENSLNSSMYYYTGQQWSKVVNFTDQPSNLTFTHKSNAATNVFTVSGSNISSRSIVAEHTGAGVGIFTSSNGGTGILAQVNGVNSVAVSGNSTDGKAVYGITTSGYAGYFDGSGRGGQALFTNGPVQVTGVGEGLGKVLTSDPSGNATWQDLPKTAFMATSTSGLTIPTNTEQVVDFTATDFNIGGSFSTTTDRFTATRNGIYHLDLQLFGQSNMVTSYIMMINIYNASNVLIASYPHIFTPASTIFYQYNRSVDVSMNSTDYAVVKISTTTTPGSTFTLSNLSARVNTFSGHYVCGL